MFKLTNLLKRLWEHRIEEKKVIPYIKKEHTEKMAGSQEEIDEFKIDIQMSRGSKNYKVLHDLLIENPESSTGYSHIDHVVITPYGIFVIETRYEQGIIYGSRECKFWLINGNVKMVNPLFQNDGIINALKNCMEHKYGEKIVSLVSFSKQCTLKVDMNLRNVKADECVMYDVNVNESIQRKISYEQMLHKAPKLTEYEIAYLYHRFKEANITKTVMNEQIHERLKHKTS
ncbi:nuclease-related domain-containing protein [Salirhabdus salicampi]|uniref:nuclease-related domain-containing protein n=1 Tax=Salirhabdus salicampi TaxID=476102 RepID=UPI0020C5AEFD|nr:nuclease-related domain-containing protein [Salirhabdus salicampi]MCP8615912.1 NERD domain-containing protein [Salirhabdus salicampi]